MYVNKTNKSKTYRTPTNRPLFAAICAASISTGFSAASHAAFDEGNAILYAYEAGSHKTYFVDLGVSGQELINGSFGILNDAGLTAFLAANTGVQWSIIASVNDPTLVTGPPAVGKSLINSGVISTSSSGVSVADNSTENEIQRTIMNNWLTEIKAASNGASSFWVNNGPASARTYNNNFFQNSLINIGGTSPLYYSQANTDYGAILSDQNEVSVVGVDYPTRFKLDFSGLLIGNCIVESCVEYQYTAVVPIPASIWLFASTLMLGAGIQRKLKAYN